ncbi:MAG: DUF2070 family protein [Candidatus Anstonellaceae archaeon]
MEAAKKMLDITKYFISLPPSREIIFLMIITAVFGGIAINFFLIKEFEIKEIFYGAGAGLIGLILPAFISAAILKIFRRKIKLNQALFLSFLGMLNYLFFILLTFLLIPIFGQISFNLIFVGFAFSFLLWFFSLNMIIGLKKSAVIFASAQLLLYLLFFSFTFSFIKLEKTEIAIKIILTVASFFVLLYLILFIISRPLKKNLNVSSNEMIEMFFSQWLYKEKDMEEALDELGQMAKTWIGVAGFKTKTKTVYLIVPYFHFGPFGSLGGSEFSYKIEQMIKTPKEEVFVFHGTATHSMDPVSSDSINMVVKKCQDAIKKLKYRPAYFDLKQKKYRETICYLLTINDTMIASYSRAPHSTEDINLAVGWALMEHMERKTSTALVIDCHNCETESVDYIEPGSPSAMDMLHTLKLCLKQKSFLTKMRIGTAAFYPEDIEGIGFGGIKVLCMQGENNKPNFWIVLDSNSILGEVREEIIEKISKEFSKTEMVEVFTTDTHQLNTKVGVFNPAGKNQKEKLIEICLMLSKEAYEKLEDAFFDMRKEQIELKVIGPYQTIEITATLNAVLAITKIMVPLLIVGSMVIVIWMLNKI